MQEFLVSVIGAIAAKYSGYTRVAANRSLWSFLFHSPVLKFDDYWIVDEKADRIIAVKRSKHEASLSGSETVLLGMWRAHFTGSGQHLKHFNMRSFGGSREKVLYFLSIAHEFPFE